MISIEKARELKEAGLKWEPQKGDWYAFDGYKEVQTVLFTGHPMNEVSYYLCRDKCTWLPSLKQLLDKIRARGFIVELTLTETCAHIALKMIVPEYYSTSIITEDAVADALLFILSRRCRK